MSRNEFVDLILKCYFADRDAANEILKYFEECEKLKDNVKEAVDYITYYLLYNNKYKDSQKQFNRLLKILERTDK